MEDDKPTDDPCFIVFHRPHLQEFLDYAFKHFNVSVWTAATKSYGLSIIEDIILKDKSRELDYIFFRYHCKLSIDDYKNKNKNVSKKNAKVQEKRLEILWKEFNLDKFNKSNTFILDDRYDKALVSQPSNCVLADEFDHMNTDVLDDDFLKRMIPKLRKLRKIGNIDSCIEDGKIIV